MIQTMMSEKVDFTKQVDGLCCHETDDSVDEASILVDQALQFNSHETGQLLSPLQLIQGKATDQ